MIEQIINILTTFFQYKETEPIVFTQVSFWVFFCCVFAVFTILHKQYTWRNLFLFLVSIFLYYKTNGVFVMLLLLSITSEYFVAKALYKRENKTKRKCLIIYSVIFNLGILSYFKYAYFFTDSFNQVFGTNNQVINYLALWSNTISGSTASVDNIVFPIGISFYTFQIMSYTLDVYRNKLKPLNNILDLGFYATFFPQILMGPIVKARDFIPQLYKPYKINGYQFGLAIFMILNGLVKKLVFGDYMAANFIDKIFGNPLLFTGVENLFAVIAYSMQVYLDFSGYTDIAIGIALLLGFKFKANFNSPYKAQNVAEFWKRWHISLSSWLQEYLYIPLGGNKKGTIASYIIITILTVFIALMLDAIIVLWIVLGIAIVLAILSFIYPNVKKAVNTNVNLMITMLLGGLWHNPKITFLIWGGLNGLSLIVYKFWRKISPYQNSKLWIATVWKITLTFLFITFTRIFFRAEDLQQVGEIFNKIAYDLNWKFAPEIIANFWLVFIFLALAFIIHFLPINTKWQIKKTFIKLPAIAKIAVVLLCVFFIYQTLSSEEVKFIYFQF